MGANRASRPKPPVSDRFGRVADDQSRAAHPGSAVETAACLQARTRSEALIGLARNKIREDVIARNWPDILRVAATLASGALPPSQLLRKFAAYPRQHELAVTLREIGRVERTLFIVDWLLDADMQRRANTGLNKGEIRDRSSEGQHYRMAGLNLLAAIGSRWHRKADRTTGC